MAPKPPPSRLRIGDRERDAVVTILRQAAADGRLTLAELDERLEAALRARTQAELVPVIADLDDGSLRVAGVGASARPPRPGYAPDDRLRLDGAERRAGEWRVPPYISINQGSRWVRLDFQQASVDSDVIDIELVGGAGWVLLVLPAGWGADLDRVSTGWGSKSVKVPAEPAPGRPLVVLHGAIGAGRLRLRTPRARDRRRARRLARRASPPPLSP